MLVPSLQLHHAIQLHLTFLDRHLRSLAHPAFLEHLSSVEHVVAICSSGNVEHASVLARLLIFYHDTVIDFLAPSRGDLLARKQP